MKQTPIRSTTILGVRLGRKVALGGDGQVTMGEMQLKSRAVKVRAFGDGQVLGGFAGAVADALTLFEKFEVKLEEYNQNLQRAAVELAKDWRTDKYLRELDALLALMDTTHSYILSGSGDIIDPEDSVFAIGSGMTSLYSGLAEVYPITVIEGLWAFVALRRFWQRHVREKEAAGG